MSDKEQDRLDALELERRAEERDILSRNEAENYRRSHAEGGLELDEGTGVQAGENGDEDIEE